jgi:hypothetical protein
MNWTLTFQGLFLFIFVFISYYVGRIYQHYQENKEKIDNEALENAIKKRKNKT